MMKRSGIAVIGLFLLYLIAGFWIVPPLIRPRLESELSRHIGRKVTIDALKLNPLLFSATTTRLIIHEIDGAPFAGFEELFVDAELSSVLKWAATFKEIRVLAPFGVLRILPGKKLNIDDILTKFSQPEKTPDQQAELPPAIISKFQIKDGQMTIDNATGTEPVRQTFSPITFSLENLSTLKEREGAYAFAGEGSSGGFYQLDGRISVNPVRVQGSYAMTGTRLAALWRHFEDHTSFQITGGTIGGSGNYILEIVDGAIHAELQNDTFEIKDFMLTEKGKDEVLISLPLLSVQGIRADSADREIVVERVETRDAQIVSWLAPDGTMKPQSLLLSDLQKVLKTEKTAIAAPETPAGPPWQAAVNTIAVAGWSVLIEDRTLPEPPRFSFDEIKATVENLSNQKGSSAGVAVALQVNRSGTVQVSGAASVDPPAADLTLVTDNITLKELQPYVDTAVNARLTRGTTSSEGRIRYGGEGGKAQIRYQGELRLDDLEIKDREQAEDFIRLAQMKASGIDLELQPNRLHAAEILIRKPHARVTIDQNGVVNVVQAFSPLQQQRQSGKEHLLRRLVDFLILQIKGPMPMAVDRVQLSNFTGDFVDASIAPPYTTRLDITSGTVEGISSEPSARADFRVQGAIDQSAAIESTGQMNPMNAFQYTEVDFSLKDFDLRSVSPYSGKYIGYNIAQGKLDLRLKYRLDADKIDGDNRIYIDQLDLGERVKSPDALKLPVALGVALLKDDKNRITLQVPVGGNIKDPKFHIGRAVTSALTKTIDDAGDSPFSAIGKIDGFKGEALRFMAFEPGQSALNRETTKKLKALAGFLKKRPAIQLGVQGTANPHIDLIEILPQTMHTESPEPQRASAKLPERDRQQLRSLAQTRASQVKAYLFLEGEVEAERIQLKPVQIISAPDQKYGRVELSLSSQ